MGDRMMIDATRSERGQQRRKTASGRLLHCCCICGHLDTWGARWSTYCSHKEMDDGEAIPKFCSEKCREAGGAKAANVTAEMKEAAKASEWREPTLAYRPMSEREKYGEAAHRQRSMAERRSAPTPGKEHGDE